ncbi:MAG: hypothetical protein C4520_13995 [Candidatus Abyssobacteria bacterium SURF_5]|uniref:Uncharacterized protein n=1 Tax=Abyssobacteria bacterium (strain SURF_5) TaxID=2093360 RepID=A0A3A4NHP4_ABYX5|nr:MAG: hypothetical protein C4520_13995 [Candidatus Abyssubacteria bacterium SURF_5]
MRFFKWRHKPPAKRKKEETTPVTPAMPDFKMLFLSLPDIVKPTTVPTEDATAAAPSSKARVAAARCSAESEAKAATSREKVNMVHARIQTAIQKHKEIVWLLQADKEILHGSLNDLFKSLRNLENSNSCKGISVNYVSDGKLREISPLTEQDLAGLARKCETEKSQGRISSQ